VLLARQALCGSFSTAGDGSQGFFAVTCRASSQATSLRSADAPGASPMSNCIASAATTILAEGLLILAPSSSLRRLHRRAGQGSLVLVQHRAGQKITGHAFGVAADYDVVVFKDIKRRSKAAPCRRMRLRSTS
jgi:hypothetical protein